MVSTRSKKSDLAGIAAMETMLASASVDRDGHLNEMAVARAARRTAQDHVLSPMEREFWLQQAEAKRLSPRQEAEVKRALGSREQTTNPVAFANGLAPPNSIRNEKSSFLGALAAVVVGGALLSGCGGTRRKEHDAPEDLDCEDIGDVRPESRWENVDEVRFVVDKAFLDRFGDAGFDLVVAAASAWQESILHLPPVMVERRDPEEAILDPDGVNVITARKLEGEYEDSIASTSSHYFFFSGEMFDADIAINTGHDFEINPPGPAVPGTENARTYDLYTTILHEMGHALGLPHLCDRVAAMFPYAKPGERKNVAPIDSESGNIVYDPEAVSGFL